MTDPLEAEGESQPAGIDWQKINSQLEQLQHAIEREWTPSPQQAQEILRARAAALARPARAAATGPQLEVVEFLLAGEHYAIESSFVREVFPLTELTHIPCTPAFVLGVANVRGEIVSVIDIKKLFGLPERGITDLNKLVILQNPTLTLGVLADSIVGVHELAGAAIQALPTARAGARDDYLIGIAPGDVVVLDAAKLLADEKIVINEVVAG